ncbi:hypothetical protein [Desulfomarina profundi]|uniref:hypothetical protein n=1 Tax=Desulfomarina profundi TaxID=2772557 RepID=UPI001E543D65|nr:hypothetical protein [Desulfomarina profundi]
MKPARSGSSGYSHEKLRSLVLESCGYSEGSNFKRFEGLLSVLSVYREVIVKYMTSDNRLVLQLISFVSASAVSQRTLLFKYIL